MSVWQIVAILAMQIIGWYLASHITETRAARREARRAVLDQKLHQALRDLFEQREHHTTHPHRREHS
ncbi:hypothetical protein [Streptomyces sp. SCL15-4]|uniref:hypothetical protein n=1 Tax=Streptomyces sp. SCL15-4 TaxID=2967221 RepID=UPI0029667E06|nr:hypothetical protein [Streptomyces sp. SCL15-4]